MSKKKKLGIVTQKEKDEILQLYERIKALEELTVTLDSELVSQEERDYLYEKILYDKEKSKMLYEKWWNNMEEKYSWRLPVDGKYLIDFETGEVFIIL